MSIRSSSVFSCLVNLVVFLRVHSRYYLQQLTLRLRIWVAFHPPGTGFSAAGHDDSAFRHDRRQPGDSALTPPVPVIQTLYFSVYKRGSKRAALRDIEDRAAEKVGLVSASAPALALPLLLHGQRLADTDALMRTQLLGGDG